MKITSPVGMIPECPLAWSSKKRLHPWQPQGTLPSGGCLKIQSLIDYGQLEECLRSDLNQKSARRMVVLKPLKVTLTNYDKIETLKVPNHPKMKAWEQEN